MSYQQELDSDNLSPKNIRGGGLADDEETVVSTSIDSFVMKRMRSSALHRWQQNCARSLKQQDQCEVAAIVFKTEDTAGDSKNDDDDLSSVNSDISASSHDEGCYDDLRASFMSDLSANSFESFAAAPGEQSLFGADGGTSRTSSSKSKRSSMARKMLSDKMDTVISLLNEEKDLSDGEDMPPPPPPPTLKKAKSSGLRRLKSEDSPRNNLRRTKSSNSAKRAMRKVVSDADKHTRVGATRFLPNSNIFEENLDRWGDEQSVASSAKNKRMAALSAASAHGPSSKKSSATNKRDQLKRAVSDYGGRKTATTEASPKSDRRRMIKRSVSSRSSSSRNTKDKSPKQVIRRVPRPDISDLGLVVVKAAATTSTSTSVGSRLAAGGSKKKSLSRTLSGDYEGSSSGRSRAKKPLSRTLSDDPGLLGIQSCHSRMNGHRTTKKKDNDDALSNSCHSAPKKPARRNSPSPGKKSPPSSPPPFRWEDHQQQPQQGAAAAAEDTLQKRQESALSA